MKQLLYTILLASTIWSSAQATDLVLGFTTNQGGSDATGSGVAEYYRFTADSNGTCDSILFYTRNGTTNDTLWFAIYADSSTSKPSHTLWILQPDTCFATSNTPGWIKGQDNSPIGLSITAGTSYWLAFAAKSPLNSFFAYRSTGTTAADSTLKGWTAFSGTWPSPPTLNSYGTGAKKNIAVYYHTAGGAPPGGTPGGNRVITIINRP